MKAFHMISVRQSTTWGTMQSDDQVISTAPTLLKGRRDNRNVALSFYHFLIIFSARLSTSILVIVTVSSCGSKDPVRQEENNYSQPGRPTELLTPQGGLFFPTDWTVMSDGRALNASSTRGPLVFKDPFLTTVIPAKVNSANPIFPIRRILFQFLRNQRPFQPLPTGLKKAGPDGWAQLGDGCMYFDLETHAPGYVCASAVAGTSIGAFRPNRLAVEVTWRDKDAPRSEWRQIRCYTNKVLNWIQTRPDQRTEKPPAYHRGDRC